MFGHVGSGPLRRSFRPRSARGATPDAFCRRPTSSAHPRQETQTSKVYLGGSSSWAGADVAQGWGETSSTNSKLRILRAAASPPRARGLPYSSQRNAKGRNVSHLVYIQPQSFPLNILCSRPVVPSRRLFAAGLTTDLRSEQLLTGVAPSSNQRRNGGNSKGSGRRIESLRRRRSRAYRAFFVYPAF